MLFQCFRGQLMRRYRKTKIVATLGPSTRTKRQIRALIMAGVDVFRLNFSHGSHNEYKEWLGEDINDEIWAIPIEAIQNENE